MIVLPRRQFLRCLVGIVAAPAVVKADGLMKIFAPRMKTRALPSGWTFTYRMYENYLDYERFEEFTTYIKNPEVDFVLQAAKPFRYVSAIGSPPQSEQITTGAINIFDRLNG